MVDTSKERGMQAHGRGSTLHTAESLVADVGRLASMPAVYQQVKAVVDDPDSSTVDMVKAVSLDPALAGRLLHVVNSAYFGMLRSVDSLTMAVGMLGMRQIHDIVLAASVHSLFRGMRPASMDMPRYWRNSVLRGLVAREAAEICEVREAERYFVEGLMADIGHLVMYQQVPQQSELAMRRAQHEARPLCDMEREVIGCNYAQVGAALANQWQLPVHIGAAIAHQVDPEHAPGEFAFDAGMLHLARAVVAGMEQERGDEDICAAIQPFVWQMTGLAQADIPLIRAEAATHHSEVMALFFPAG